MTKKDIVESQSSDQPTVLAAFKDMEHRFEEMFQRFWKASPVQDTMPGLFSGENLLDMPKMDVMVSIPPTSPLRSASDVDNCVQRLLDSDADIAITVKPSDRNPYFNMVTLDDTGMARLVSTPMPSLEHSKTCSSSLPSKQHRHSKRSVTIRTRPL